MIRVKRIYDPPSEDDGHRILVDRLWPRGMAKDSANISLWAKDVAPSGPLRKWFGHEPSRWAEFQRRYRQELEAMPEALERILNLAREGTVTLLFAARDSERNNAVALREYLESLLAG